MKIVILNMTSESQTDLLNYNVYDSQNKNVEYEFAIPENYYSKTKIKVEW